jgi:hypothetical protein
MKEIGQPKAINPQGGTLKLPLGDRLFLECSGLSHDQVITALENARIIS